MPWQDHLTTVVRVLINDLDPPYEYSDARIEQVVVVAATYVQFDVNLDYSYVIDVVAGTIAPDPTVNNDAIFLSLVGLKTACIFDQSTLRTKAALEGVSTRLGAASLSLSGSVSGWNDIIAHGACALYEELTSHWDIKNATAIAAVLSPFAGNKFNPRSLLRDSHRNTYGNNDMYA
jgi:hypothetical protein